jgi:hypothetical protein
MGEEKGLPTKHTKHTKPYKRLIKRAILRFMERRENPATALLEAAGP